ncbi:MAG: phosphomannomutase/phosphoglucomutase [Moraxella sp.]|nr:phosphomannomutase/phosphoglucomutase [Moraxella sp.]
MQKTTFTAQKSLFRAYDIRGAAALFSPAFITRLAHCLTEHYKNQGGGRLIIAHDARQDSGRIAHIFADIATAYKLDVVWLGLGSTPLMAYTAKCHDGHGIIITASHSPKDILGIKWLTHNQSPTSDEILALYQTVANDENRQTTPLKNPSFNSPSTRHTAQNAYAHAILSAYHSKKTWSLVVDCLNGVTGELARAIFSPLCHQLILLNDTPNGTFPKGNPDPSEPHRLAELCAAVKKEKADLGLAFDGDGDRLAVVDSTGRQLPFDELIYWLAQSAKTPDTPDDATFGTKHHPMPNASLSRKKILFDVKCSHLLPKLLKKDDFTCVMTKTGSSHLRQALDGEHKDAVFAGELSGHFVFNDNKALAHDDGIYAAVRLLSWLSVRPPLVVLSQTLPKAIATPDLYVSLPTHLNSPKFFMNLFSNHIKKVLEHNPNLMMPSFIDGVRMDFESGFGLVRASNTSDQLTVRLAADSNKEFSRLVTLLCEFISSIKDTTLPADALADFSNALKHTLHRYQTP